MKKKKYTHIKFSISEKGISLYLSIVIMAVILAIALGISAILLGQIKMIRGMEFSVNAFYAADSGIEQALYKLFVERAPLPFNIAGTVGEASYSVQALAAGTPNCPSPPNGHYCIKSFGRYKETIRAIEVNE